MVPFFIRKPFVFTNGQKLYFISFKHYLNTKIAKSCVLERGGSRKIFYPLRILSR